MTIEEKVDKILETVLPLVPMVEEHHITLYGNGQPGIKEELVLVKQRQKDCPARKAATNEGKKISIAHAALIVSIISCIIVTVSQIMIYFRG